MSVHSPYHITMKSTKIKLECKDCEEFEDCKEKDNQKTCSTQVLIMVANQLLGI